MSSFRRADHSKVSASSASQASIRQHCVSSGLRELDGILGGGVGLGTVTLIGEDTFSNHAETLMAYMIAEACSQSHDLLLISAPSGIDVSGNILSRLPMNQSRDPDDKAVVSGQDQRDSTGLKIAWQYGKYLKRDEAPDSVAAGGVSKATAHGRQQYCHSYDLARRLQDSILSNCKIEVFTPPSVTVDPSIPFQPAGTLENFLHEVYECIKARCDPSMATAAASGVPGKRNPLRIFMPSIGGYDRHFSRQCGDEESRKMVMLFFLKLKHLIRNRDNCVTLVISTGPACHTEKLFLPTLNNIADNVFVLESFDGHGNTVPVEYRHFCAFFHVVKLTCNYVLTPFHPPSNHYGIKRDSRKLLIELLHLPPEDGDAADSSTASNKPMSSGSSCSASITNKLNEI